MKDSVGRRRGGLWLVDRSAASSIFHGAPSLLTSHARLSSAVIEALRKMHAHAELFAGPHAARSLVGRCTAATRSLGRRPPLVVNATRSRPSRSLSAVLKLLDLLAELKLEACLGLGVQIARFHARVEIERLR